MGNPVKAFNRLNGKFATASTLERVRKICLKNGRKDLADRLSKTISQLKGKEVVRVRLASHAREKTMQTRNTGKNSLKGSWHAKNSRYRHTTDEKQKLKPGHKFNKEGEIVKTKPKKKKGAKPTPKDPKKGKQAPSKNPIEQPKPRFKNGDEVILTKQWGMHKSKSRGKINQRKQHKGTDGTFLYNVNFGDRSDKIPEHALDKYKAPKRSVPKNKPTAKKTPPPPKVDKKGQLALLSPKPNETTENKAGMKAPIPSAPKPDIGSAKSFTGEAGGPRVSDSKNTRVFHASDIVDMHFETIDLEDKWGQLFQNPAKKMSIGFKGKPKNGKTSGSMQFASEICKFGKVLYNVSDQGINKSTQDLIVMTGLDKNPNALVSTSTTPDELEEDIKEFAPDYVFIDLINDHINNGKIKPHEFKNRFKKGYPDVAFQLIFEATKSGDFKGEQAWMHMVDQIVDVEDYMMASKGRYGMGECVIWEEGAQKMNPKRYTEILSENENAPVTEQTGAVKYVY